MATIVLVGFMRKMDGKRQSIETSYVTKLCSSSVETQKDHIFITMYSPPTLKGDTLRPN